MRLLGADAAHLGSLAREAHPQYRAVDHEEASQMHYAARNMHAARAHEAASAAMSKSTTGPTTSVTGKPLVPAYDSDLTWVYQGADASLTPEQAAVAIQAATLGWAPQDHMDMGVVQHGLALALGDEPDKQALCAAAAFMHLSAAGAAPGVDLGKSLNAKLLRPKAGHKHAQIGTARSGKPIFNAFNHPAHAGFTTADHVDHIEAMARHYRGQGKLNKAGKGEGSRGGHVIGHTKSSGRPIYADGSHTESFNVHDHAHASMTALHHGDNDLSYAHFQKVQEALGTRVKASNFLERLKQGKLKASDKLSLDAKPHAGGEAFVPLLHRTRAARLAHEEAAADYARTKGPGPLPAKDNPELVRTVYGDGSPEHERAKVAAAEHAARVLAHAQAQKQETEPEPAQKIRKPKAQKPKKAKRTYETREIEASGPRGPIGQTRSGKPVFNASGPHYAGLKGGKDATDHDANSAALSHNTRLVLKKNPDFTSRDHEQAAEHHATMSREADNHQAGQPHWLASSAHDKAARKLRLTEQKAELAAMATRTHKSLGDARRALAKGLEALADNDALRQMGQTVAAKHPAMTAADHLAASQNYARAGQPHLAIGHMIASTLKTPAAHQSVLSRAGA